MREGAGVSTRGILRPEAVGRAFHLARHPPSEALARFVERYWIVRWDLRGQPPHLQETLPQPCVNIAIEAGRSAVHGVCTRRFQVELSGAGQVFGVKLRPGAYQPFHRRPVAELTDRIIPLAEAFATDTAPLERAVLATDDDAAQIALFEAFFAPRLPAPDENVERVVRVVQTALAEPSITRVEELSERTGVSVRTLQRLFHRYVGVSPKWVIQRFRLHEAADRVAAGAVVDWAALAAELGYFDQAHFIHDFRAQVGCTPAEYAARGAERRAG